MGINNSFFDHLKKHEIFGEAFVDELPNKPDVLVKDISHWLRKLCLGKSTNITTWNKLRDAIVRMCSDDLRIVNTVHFGADNPEFVPYAKQVEASIRQDTRERAAKVQEKKNLEYSKNYEPFTESELQAECFTERKHHLPDMNRAFSTPKVKDLLASNFSNVLLEHVPLDPSSSPVKTIIVDGVKERLDPLERVSCEPKTFVKRSSVGPAQRLESVRIGESDLRWVRWLGRWGIDGDEMWGRHDSSKPITIVLDLNDGDALPIALINLSSFVIVGEDFPFRLFIHHGQISRWTSFLPLTTDPKALEERKSGRMIDVIRLYEIVIAKLRGEFGLFYAVEIFCALLLMGGSDFVKSIGEEEKPSLSSPFKDFGPKSILEIFMKNEMARREFSSQIFIPSCVASMGKPQMERKVVFLNESLMLGLVKRFYQKKLKAFGLADELSERHETFERIREADFKRLAMKSKSNEITTIQAVPTKSSGFVKKQKKIVPSRVPSPLLLEHEAIATMRRLLWNLYYIMTGWTGNYILGCSTQRHAATGLSLYGFEYDPNTKKIRLSRKVFTG